jgi:hypothetical protein
LRRFIFPFNLKAKTKFEILDQLVTSDQILNGGNL